MPKLIIVCGLPGSGKTTFSDALSKKIKVACIHKDSVKERLFESLKLSSLEDSKRIGKPSVDVAMRLTEDQLKNGIDIILESPFYFPEDSVIFEAWQERYKIDLYSVICSIDFTERSRRFRERERHYAHFDNERSPDHLAEGPDYDYALMPGKQIRIKTNEPVEILIGKVLKEIN
ncbi:MAG: hypothetical protein ACD_56C00159G0006 [uncultured bacterium]|nr:MAG: hypothetical protein ACD_56C00159G0006 [uncultured bacterium]